MIEHIILGIVAVLVLGSSAQWLAWRFNVPSILLLLLFGFLAGPILQLLPPASLQGEWVYAFVSLSIGIILFEGGLSLQLSELREVGKAVRNLITVGVLVTWVLITLAAYFLVDFSVEMSVLIGAILTVTGPTVVIPLLRQVRPRGRVGVIARWEGITIDPIGAILAVLVLEAIILLRETGSAGGDLGEAVLHTVGGLLTTVAVGGAVSLAGAALLILLLNRRMVPDYLQGTVALVIVIATFAFSNLLREESGLLEATLLGIMMANQKYVPVRRISEFKENLQVVLIGSLFIVLSARLELGILQFITVDTLLFLAVLIFIVRPLSVLLSSYGTDLNWREQVFLAWMAPRGIVAAAVASLFAFELEGVLAGAAVAGLAPTVFMVIVGTVAVYGLTISPLARGLELAEPSAQGLLFVGGHPWALQMARAVQQLGFSVLVVDTNPRNVEQARKSGLPAERTNVLSETVMEDLDLSGIGRLLAVTPNDEVNSLAALHFSEIFDSAAVYQLPMRSAGEGHAGSGMPSHLPHLRGRTLFSGEATYGLLTERFTEGGEIEVVELTEEVTFEHLQQQYGGDVLLLFVIRGGRELFVHSAASPLLPLPGDRVIVLVPPATGQDQIRAETPFERLVVDAAVIDLEAPSSYHEIIRQASEVLTARLPVSAQKLTEAFFKSWQYGTMLAVKGIALPHCRMPDIGRPQMVLVRCRSGIEIAPVDQETAAPERTYAIFFLVSDEANPGEHLRILANISSRIDEPTFIGKWQAAENEQQVKEALLRDDRYLSVRIDADDSPFADRPVGFLSLPKHTLIALVARNGEIFRPSEETMLTAGDRMTVIGNPHGLQQLQRQLEQEVQR